MTQQVFSDYIGQSPATLSSIFNGRTRPTLNIVEAIKKKIPNISTDWLMFGSGEMYLPVPTSEPGTSDIESSMPSDVLPGNSIKDPMLLFDESQSPTPQNAVPTQQQINSVRITRPDISRTEVKFIDKPQRRVKEIRVFYDDQTWETFVPEKK